MLIKIIDFNNGNQIAIPKATILIVVEIQFFIFFSVLSHTVFYPVIPSRLLSRPYATMFRLAIPCS